MERVARSRSAQARQVEPAQIVLAASGMAAPAWCVRGRSPAEQEGCAHPTDPAAPVIAIVPPRARKRAGAVPHVWYTKTMPSFLTARQAAKLLGKAERTASRRAREAAQQGDPQVIRIGQAWAAPEAWWREHLVPRQRGRPKLPQAAPPGDDDHTAHPTPSEDSLDRRA
ncbi:MAG TPA: hypothetical protein VF510_22035 [Ktedonobacterales bacterium]